LASSLPGFLFSSFLLSSFFRHVTIPPVTLPAEKQSLHLMRNMFSTVAPRYDFITRAFSYGMDRRWKRDGVASARLPEGPVVLDLAAGTGDFSLMVRQRYPGACAVAVDLTERMLQLAQDRGVPHTVCGDAGRLPFPDACFDCVYVGYGLRNFPDLDAAIREIARVTKPGGQFVSLDFFLPANAALRHVYLGYLYAQGAFWGTVLHGQPRVYTYIPDSLRSFVSIRDFSSLLGTKGYGRVNARSFVLGGIGLHWAEKGAVVAQNHHNG
jgi:demethylmenaquinone methyltransferase/2-methoxy-6-polyprenyl-1,4-benzoquinol methylase